MHNFHVALYGATRMLRGFCKPCGGYALVIEGKFLCCDRACIEPPTAVKRMTQSDGVRRKPSAAQQAEILEKQGNQCLYCEREFGSYACRNGRMHKLKLCWDHLIPFAYSQSCTDQEFVAACHRCNGIKGAQMFQTVEGARAAIQLRLDAKGWS